MDRSFFNRGLQNAIEASNRTLGYRQHVLGARNVARVRAEVKQRRVSTPR